MPDVKTTVSLSCIFSSSNEFNTRRLNNINHTKLLMLLAVYNMDCVRTNRLRSSCFWLFRLSIPPVTEPVTAILLPLVVLTKSCRADRLICCRTNENNRAVQRMAKALTNNVVHVLIVDITAGKIKEKHVKVHAGRVSVEEKVTSQNVRAKFPRIHSSPLHPIGYFAIAQYRNSFGLNAWLMKPTIPYDIGTQRARRYAILS